MLKYTKFMKFKVMQFSLLKLPQILSNFCRPEGDGVKTQISSVYIKWYNVHQ